MSICIFERCIGSSFNNVDKIVPIIDHLPKAELMQYWIKSNSFFLILIHLFAWEIISIKKLEMEETKTTYSTFKTDIIKVGLVFSISNFFISGK